MTTSAPAIQKADIGICIVMFIIGELVKPLYTKIFKDYREVKSEK